MKTEVLLRGLNRILVGLVLAIGMLSGASAKSRETVLHVFNGTDGWEPMSSLVFDAAGNLYGTTHDGGASNFGNVFELTPGSNGHWTEKVLYAFSGGADGRYPDAGLIFDSAGSLYGTTEYGGNLECSTGGTGCGVVFKLTPSTHGSWTESVLHTFDSGTDGAQPGAALTFDAVGNLYGTTVYGGYPGGGSGTVFELSQGSNGQWTETVLYAFRGGPIDGANPVAKTTFDSQGDLYGTTLHGGSGGVGTAFRLSPDGNGKWTETTLFTFSTSAGYFPHGGLVIDPAENLYGTTEFGGAYGWGNVFELSLKNGQWTETILHSFQITILRGGAYALGDLVFDGAGNLYGTTDLGGGYGYGNVFRLTPHSDHKWTETVLHSFSKSRGGSGPWTGVILDSAGHLYGTTFSGGTLNGVCGEFGNTGCGVIFEITP